MSRTIRLFANKSLALIICLLMLFSVVSPAISAETNTESAQIYAPVMLTDSADTTGISVNKYAEQTQQDDEFVLTLESFSRGSTVVLPKNEPMDIVFVLDQSGSMHAPVGVTENLYNDHVYDISGAMSASELDYEKAGYQGYYIAQSRSGRQGRDENGVLTMYYDWFIVWYVDGYWYYVRKNVNYSPANFDFNYQINGNDTNLIDATLRRDVPIAHFNYYKTQFGALHDAMIEFIDDVKETGVNHKIAITGFASPSMMALKTIMAQVSILMVSIISMTR